MSADRIIEKLEGAGWSGGGGAGMEPYDATKQYAPGDMVMHGGNAYWAEDDMASWPPGPFTAANGWSKIDDGTLAANWAVSDFSPYELYQSGRRVKYVGKIYVNSSMVDIQPHAFDSNEWTEAYPSASGGSVSYNSTTRKFSDNGSIIGNIETGASANRYTRMDGNRFIVNYDARQVKVESSKIAMVNGSKGGTFLNTPSGVQFSL